MSNTPVSAALCSATFPKLLFIPFFALTVLVVSCNPWVFDLNKDTGWPVEGRILKNYDSVDVVSGNAIQISGDSKIAMRCVNVTDGVFSSDVQLRYGTLLTLEFRSTPFDDSTSLRNGLILTIGRDEVKAELDGKSTTVPTSQTTNKPFIVVITHQGNWIDVDIACTKIGRFKSQAPSTQWLLANTSAPGSALFVNPRFEPLSMYY